jgi:hypothetical protein
MEKTYIIVYECDFWTVTGLTIHIMDQVLCGAYKVIDPEKLLILESNGEDLDWKPINSWDDE